MEAQKDNGFQEGSEVEIQYIYKKIENIVAAVFLVTNLVSDSELVKTTIRQTALDCLSLGNKASRHQQANVVMLQDIIGELSHISSLLDIAFWSGLITQMNVSVLQKEIEKTKTLLLALVAKYKNKYFVNSSFFVTDDELLSVQKANAIKGQGNFSAKLDNKGQDKGQKIKDNSNVLYPKPAAPFDESKKNRREAIVNLLRSKSNLTVKDFGSVIPEYSEKTIQRELQALVEEGIVHKQGERRWSTYSLAR